MFSRTERLLLRPGWPEDAPALHAAIADPAIVRNLATAPWPYALSDAEAFLSRGRNETLPEFLIFKRTHGAPRLVGACGISERENGAHELGYWIARPYWGLGFATEAADAVMRITRSARIRNVTASHFVDNPASGRVLCKVGFRPTGRMEKRRSRARDADANCVLFEDGGVKPMRHDLAATLYRDRPSIAA